MTRKLTVRTPFLERPDAFIKRETGVRVTPRRESESGKWETTEPGQETGQPYGPPEWT